MYNLGIDIGGTFIKYALVDKDYNIIEKWKKKTLKFETKDNFYDYLCEDINNKLNNINSIGVSAPGLVDNDSNIKSYAAPNVLIMFNTNVNYEIYKRTSKKVATINDAKSAGLCELKIGNAQKTKSSAFLIIGTGTGGCICNNKDVIYGVDGFAAEFHHLPFLNKETNTILRQGDFCSITALINIYNDKVDNNNKLTYGHEIIQKYLSKDTIAISSLEEWTNNIIIQLLTITIFYNPEIICIGGGISEEDWFIEIISYKFYNTLKNYLNTNILSTKISKCKYNNDANILGAILKVNMV